MRAAFALLVLLALALPAQAPAAPNLVVIETDDQTVADLDSMPLTRELIGGEGVTFRESFVSLSQCCPSRATLLTGRYAHNHGVLSSAPPFGGAARLKATETLAVWLRRAGYATVLVGKYLNGYGRHDPYRVPPGWTEWHAVLGGSTYRYYDYEMNHDGRVRRYGTAPGDYQTDVVTTLAERVIRRRAAGRRPFFLWAAYVAPHTGQPRDVLDPPGVPTAVPAPRHRDKLAGALLPRTPAFNEQDVSDKPHAIASRPRIHPEALWETWRQRRESLLAVDEGVGRIVRALRESGELRDTLVVFTSDNGFMTGEHRLAAGKIVPYEPSIRVPLLMRGPGIPRGAVRTQPVWNGDLAPTLLDAARASAPWPLDGMSLLPLVRRPGLRPARDLLLEGPTRRGLLRYTGLRTPYYTYVEHLDGQVELYDLARDPWQLENLADRPEAAWLRALLASRLAVLRGCEGAACRQPARAGAQPGAAYTRHDRLR